jgi:hypothetical protein
VEVDGTANWPNGCNGEGWRSRRAGHGRAYGATRPGQEPRKTPSNNPSHESEPERRTLNLDELERRALCKKRLGRASLTIRRSGPGLVGEHELAETVSSYREGSANADDVVWALVRARVIKHSPTFRWDDADRARLRRLVVECSDEPTFGVVEPEAIADVLVREQDAEIERLRELSSRFAESFGAAATLKQAVSPELARWAEEQRRAFVNLERSAGGSRALAKQVAAVTRNAAILEESGALRAVSAAAKQMEARRRVLESVPTPHYSSLLAQEFRMSSPVFADRLRQILDSPALRGLRPDFSGILNLQPFTLPEVVGVARSAAAVLAEQGARQTAQDLEALTGEVEATAEGPSVERLERMVGDLAQRFEEEARKRERDRRDDLGLALLLFFLNVYLAIFLWMLSHGALGC